MAITSAQVQQLYVGYLGRAADKAGLDYWLAELNASPAVLTLEDLRANFVSEQAEYAAVYGNLTVVQTVAKIYENLFERAAEPAGLAYWVGEVEAGRVPVDQLIVAFLASASAADRLVVDNKVEVANAYTAEAGVAFNAAEAAAIIAGVDGTSASKQAALDAINADPVAPVPVNTTFALTAETDNLVGTAGNDQFNAFAYQNQFVGGINNTLSSADKINGGAGTDTLFAELVAEAATIRGEAVDVQPRTVSVENIEIEARDLHVDFYTGPADENAGYTVSVDAKHMYGVERIGSKQSDGDLVIENLTTLANDGVTKRNTSDLTITMDHTDNTNTDGDASDLKVLFDDNYLISGQTAQAQAFFFLLDEDADLAGNPNRLDRINVDGLRFSLDGGATIIDLEDPAAQLAGTHEGFVAGLQDELAGLIAAGVVPEGTTLTLNPAITDSTFLDNGQPSLPIPAIVLTIGDGTVVTPLGFSQVQDAIGEYDVYGRFNATSEIADEPVSVNVELTKVGRGGIGGDLKVGAKSLVNGIEVINVTVNGGENLPNNLGTLATTGSKLDTVNIASDMARADYASLTIRNGFGQNSLNLVNANEFKGDLTLGNVSDVQNLTTLTATGGGDVRFFGELNANGRGYSYTTGAGNDRVDLDVDSNIVDTIGESLTVVTNDGNDTVVINNEDRSGASQTTMRALGNVNVNTGAGDDLVVINGDIRANITAGSGDDFVVINDGSSVETLATLNGFWAFGTSTAANGVDFADQVLYSAKLTVTFAGFESTVDVRTDAAGNFIADQLTINAAIKEAIDANADLARLLNYIDGTGIQQLLVQSTVPGLNALGVTVSQPDLVVANAGANQVVVPTNVLSALVKGLMDTGVAGINSSSDAAAVANAINAQTVVVEALNTGGSANSVASINFSEINMGAGANDLVVLDSNVASINTLVVDGVFNKVSVVNFFGAPMNLNTLGQHALDFTALLNNQVDASQNNNNLSAVAVDVTLNGDATAEANSVSLLSFNDALTNSVSFASLDAATLLGALNGTNTTTVVGGLNNATLNAAANTANLVGTVQKHVVMVENAQNLGEYKVFALTSTYNANGTTEGNFSGAELLGVMDFGASINADVNLVGNAVFDAFYANVLAAFDAGMEIPTEAPTEAPADAQTDVVVADLQTYDASNGAFNFILDFTAAGVKLANLDGFGVDDTITVRNAPTGSTLDLDGSVVAGQLDVAYGDLDAFSNAWVVSLLNQDAQLVADVVAAEPNTVTQVGIIKAAYGADWFAMA